MRVMREKGTSPVLCLAILNSNSINQISWLGTPTGSETKCLRPPIWEALESSTNPFLTILPGKSSCPHFQRRHLKLKERLARCCDWLVGTQGIRIQVCIILHTIPYMVTKIVALAERHTLLGGLRWID